MTAGKDQPLCGLDEVTTGGFSPFFSIVVFRCLRYATDLLHFVSEILSEEDFWYISLLQLSLDRIFVIIYLFNIIFKFLAFQLKSGILPYAAEIILLSPGTCSCFVNKIQWAS